MEVGQRWRVRRALYGLQTSPRDWAVYRDAEMRAMVVQTEEPSTLTQSQTDDSMWLVRTKKGNVLGLIVVYVDDIAVFGTKEVTQKVAEAFMAKWKTSTPLWPSPTEPVSFCGMEVARLSDGWRITQSKYLKEVLRRYEVDGVASCPMPRWEEPELEQASLGQVREAQAITGAVLWAVTRTRPDLMFVAARMSQYSTKSPVAVKAWGMHALRYVASILTLGLEYKESPGPMLGEFQQLSLPRSNDTLELYSDASHAPGGGKSMQTTVAVWRGGLVAWEATRQPFVTLSSAEAELVSMVHSLQMSDSIVPVIEELVQVDLRTALMADSAAALASFAPSSGSWRNRHLRLRAAAARERVEWGTLNAAYIPGELQVADIGTKPLSGQRILGLLRIVGVRTAEEEDVSSLAAKTMARMGQAGFTGNQTLPSAVVLAVAALACLPKAAGQPPEVYHDKLEWFRWWVQAFGGLIIAIVLGLSREVYRVREGLTSGREEELPSPRLRNERPSSSSAGPQGANRPLLPSQSLTGVEIGGSPSCVFPMVGRVDPRSNWAPAHFLRWVLSQVGGHVVTCLGLGAVEIWLCRSLARTFRYGIAFAYEKARGQGPLVDPSGRLPVYDIAQANLRGNLQEPEDPADDDSTIDQVRHIPGDIEPVRYFRLPDPGNSNSEDSTESPWSSSESGSEEELEVPRSEGSHGAERGTASQGSQVTGNARPEESGGISSTRLSYRAVDGALVVVCADDEFRVELPGWTMEEVHAIVECIRRGNWDLFHEVMSWGNPRGPISEGNESLPDGDIAIGALEPLPESEIPSSCEEQQLIEIEGLLSVPWTPSVWSIWIGHMGQGWWLFFSGVFVWGVRSCVLSCLQGSEIGGWLAPFGHEPTFDDAREALIPSSWDLTEGGAWLITAWVFLGLHRVGALVLGSLQDPPGFVLQLQGIEGPVHMPAPTTCGIWLWILLVVIFGMCHPAAASNVKEKNGSLVVFQTGHPTESRRTGRDLCLAEGNPVEERSTLLGGCLTVCFVIALWETFRRGWCRCRVRATRTIGVQTTDMGCVPLPLEEGVPYRAKILYCLWRAGYLFPVEQYPPGVQEEFHRYIGGFMRRQSVDEGSSDD